MGQLFQKHGWMQRGVQIYFYMEIVFIASVERMKGWCCGSVLGPRSLIQSWGR